MDTIFLILCGSVEESTSEPNDNVGVVSVVYVSNDKEKIDSKLEDLQKTHPDNFYIAYEVPMDTDLTTLEHYPGIEISKEDLN
ncbi:MAG: hypothetical protein K6G87_11530 [Butyrivibrio sp.]|uniref:hypothetical protein n=1 Tax=Butyrivibrio sp. TaxID=28121 RepID=UPI0025F55157|nr:hypothetical protein [Butyrivibrio sp.]MCR5771843.1 hypothetical protein [Butyrivibrio sp.]